MSEVLIKKAMGTAVNAMSPSLATQWANVPFTPTVGTPYQIVTMLPVEPANLEYGSTYQAQGILSIALMYPIEVGTGTALARAELIRTTFTRGNTYTSGAVNVVIQRTPDIKPGRVEEDRWMIPVDIRYFAHIGA